MDARTLVVDGEPETADLVEAYLKSEGCTVLKYDTGIEALAMIWNQALDLTILGVTLPDINGSALCGEIRKGHHSPIFVLAVKAEGVGKVASLTIDADDYIIKPFSPLKLMVQVKVQLCRHTRYNEIDKAGNYWDIIDFNSLVINRATYECALYGRELGLTSIKFGIL